MRVLVALSGGVDSAVACALMVREGHEVIGVTLHLADLSKQGLGVSRCCSLDDVENARAVCTVLGVPHYVFNMEDSFRREVLDLFVEGYFSGKTPSPCVRCNSRVKFGELVKILDDFEADIAVSGHYARLVKDEQGRAHLFRAHDREKDQSYFLFDLTPKQLSRLHFPLGELTKNEVRLLAKELGLPNAFKPDSQEVCFVPHGRNYADVLRVLAPNKLPGPGEVVDSQGQRLGFHRGFVHFTVGQRRGLGIASGRRLYVTEVDPHRNRVIVGGEDELFRTHLEVREVNWLIAPKDTFRAKVQIRSHHQPEEAEIEVAPDRLLVHFLGKVMAPAPGQAAVFYLEDEVLGGGFITRSWN